MNLFERLWTKVMLTFFSTKNKNTHFLNLKGTKNIFLNINCTSSTEYCKHYGKKQAYNFIADGVFDNVLFYCNRQNNRLSFDENFTVWS